MDLCADGLLVCCVCGLEKPASEFRRLAPVTKRTTSRKHRCVECHRKYNKAYHKAHPEKVREYGNRAYKKMKDAGKVRDTWLPRVYGITSADYGQLLEAQGGKCAICGAENSSNRHSSYFYVDHDHKTGEIRGLLCSHCNTGIGMFDDDAERLCSAIKYLRRAEGLALAS